MLTLYLTAITLYSYSSAFFLKLRKDQGKWCCHCEKSRKTSSTERGCLPVYRAEGLLRGEDGVDDDLVVVTGASLDQNQAVSGT